MKRGHVLKGAKQRKPRKATLDHYTTMGAAIERSLGRKTVRDLLRSMQAGTK